MSENVFSLRSEARPVPYWKHHRRAQESINFIIRVINAAAARVEESEGNSGDLSLDTNRASRICFVSGEPGSGKSTLYLTLRAMLAKKENIYSEGYSQSTGKNLSNLQGAVKLLEPLDLEVAGNERENLLAAVLVRLFRNLTPSSGNINSGNCEDAIKELEELATDIGIAWDGNLQARAGALDPDTYSGEVMRTQSARLGVNERLRDALAKITEKECFGCTKETLFVLPVDDLYLNPDASLQLLRLLRMISIPRLFFLVMGDINTVEALFIEKSLADWTGVAGNELFAYNPERFDDALTRARELRARYLRKLLPPGQRTAIAAMDWYEALNLEVGLTKDKEKTGEVLEELLAKVKLDNQFSKEKSKFNSLLSFLISPPLISFCDKEFETEKEKRANIAKGKEDTDKVALDEFSLNRKELRKYRSAYTAVQILDSTPREMLDLASSLREIILKQENPSKEPIEEQIPELLSSIRDIVNLVREENSFLNSEQQKILEEVLPTRVYYPEDLSFKTDRLYLEQIKRPWKKQIPGELWVRSQRSWDLGPRIEDKENNNIPQKKNESNSEKTGIVNIPTKKTDSISFFDKNPFAKLPPRPAAWFILLHDIAWELSPDSITVNLVNKLCQKLNETPVQKQKDEEQFESSLGWAFGNDGGEYKHFPLPKFNTFRDLDRFLFVWNRGLEWLDKKRLRLNELENEVSEAKKQLDEAQKEVEKFEARQSGIAQEKEGDILQKKAVAEIAQQNAQQKQQLHDEAMTQVGTNNSEKFKKLIYLWGLAASTVLDKQYDDFAVNDSKTHSDWFQQNLSKFNIIRYKNRLSSECQGTLEKFLTQPKITTKVTNYRKK